MVFGLIIMCKKESMITDKRMYKTKIDDGPVYYAFSGALYVKHIRFINMHKSKDDPLPLVVTDLKHCLLLAQ